MGASLFIVTGSLCLAIALVQAWLLVAVFSSEANPVARLIPGRQDLLKSHIDYLMMSQFLFIFFVLYKYLEVAPPLWVIACVCIGAIFNPFAFFVRAMKPAYLKQPPVAFVGMITTSCILTTVGFGTTAWLFAEAAIWPSAAR